ncbi:NADPH:quinone oxidoreductase family protein [Isoptericola sp. NEAU-Y5]|uniref:NADPH:quinone oxidoreductase family protein n=1 Tax=Isoptericola luteus TaxID=2879484 RepID=A0ABS7ZG89_9MICO|nr:NADPH:quinone oxidoreductase family protein [Isoptericola sp. NEAU-Y5]MCA5893487.1 NADPH:quinone oxidoreductase family protein [Isoptericola sp. NEAU-Y5]
MTEQQTTGRTTDATERGAATLPQTMRAWQVVRHGEPAQVLERADLPVPQPAADEVLVRVRAVAVNFPDALLARGQYQVQPDLPFVPGIELCGDVVALGADAHGSGLQVGDRVVGSKIGVLAQYAAVPVAAVREAPESLDDAQASALTIAYQTAWFGLHRRAALQAGEWLLVHAAAGGVGTAACQLGAAAGARVIGVVGSEAKADVARAAGAEHVIVRDADGGIAARVKELTAGSGADVVFDPVGGASFEQSTRCIALEGRIVVVGFASGEIPPVRANHALVKNYSVLGLHWALYQQRRPELVDAAHAELARLAEAGPVRPVIQDVVGFDDAPGAVQRLADGRTTGRLVIRVAD